MKFIKLNEVYRDSGLGKWFHDESAGGKPGWDRYDSSGKRVGECGDAKKGEAYAACLSKQKAQKLGKKGISKFVKRKRSAQTAAGRGKKGSGGGKGKKPVFVKTGAGKMNECTECQNNNVMNFITEGVDMIFEGKNKPTQPKKWSACISAAKRKFDVYPSAYANAWASKCYKSKGGGWKKTKKSVNEETLNEVIKKRGNNWVLMNQAGTKVLGTHSSRAKAVKQEQAINIQKHLHEDPKPTAEELQNLKNDTKFIKLGPRSNIKECFDTALHHLIEGKKKNKPWKLSTGPRPQQTSKSFSGGATGKSGSENKIRRREGKREAQQLD